MAFKNRISLIYIIISIIIMTLTNLDQSSANTLISLPDPGMIEVQPVEPIQGEIDLNEPIALCQKDSGCKWCGDQCILSKENMICPQVMPPEGYECKCVQGKCSKKEKQPIITPTEPLSIVIPLPEPTFETPSIVINTSKPIFATDDLSLAIGKIKPLELEKESIIIKQPKDIKLDLGVIKPEIPSSPTTTPSSVPAKPATPEISKPVKVKNLKIFDKKRIGFEIAFDEEDTYKVNIEKAEKNLILETNGIMAETKHSLEIGEEGIYINEGKIKKEIKILPDIAYKKIKKDNYFDTLLNINLELDNEEFLYKIKGIKKGLLVGIFPLETKIEAELNANTGMVEDIKKPWWSFLLFNIN